MELIEYPDREVLALDLADVIASELGNQLRHEERAMLVVPGGTTPGPVFDALCAARLDWDRVDIALSDERWVPEDHPRSNTALVKSRLMVERAAAARFLPFYAGGDDPDPHLGRVADGMAAHLPVSVALLGMGDDMHTASLFPRGDNLRLALDPQAPVLVSMRVDSQPEVRVTFSAPVLRAALSLHIVIMGVDKRAALERAQGLRPEEAPVAALLGDAVVHWAP